MAVGAKSGKLNKKQFQLMKNKRSQFVFQNTDVNVFLLQKEKKINVYVKKINVGA